MIHTYFLGIEAFVILGYLLGSAFFPKRYPLIFYKFFGITVFTLLLWYLSLWTGAGWTSLVPVVFILLLTVAAAITVYWKNRIRLPSRAEVMTFLGMELLSYVLFLFLVYLRTYKTDILGTEKLMDVALINAVMKQNHIPIENPWLAGFYMNYYYFGHFMLGLFQYLFQVPTAVGYNLAISLFGVWIVQAGYLVARALRLSDIASMIAALVMTFGGNLYLLIQTLQHTQANQWFASATRVIPYTINEFPAYSVVLGDLHGHYLSYPFFLIGIFLLLDMFFPAKSSEKKMAEREVAVARKEWLLPKSIFLGVLLGHLYLTNSWDIFSLALLGLVLVVAVVLHQLYIRNMKWEQFVEFSKQVLLWIALPVGLFSLPQFLASRSYYLPPVGGIGINTVFSGPWELFMLFGQFLLIAAMGGALYRFLLQSVGKVLKKKLRYAPELMLPLLLVVTGAVLVFTVEIIYAKDIFTTLNPPYARTNTVFKIYFHVWSLFALGTLGFFLGTFWQVLRHAKPTKWLYAIYAGFSVVIAIVISYSFISIDQYIAPKLSEFTLKRVADPRWSNGYSYMVDQHPGDYALISYLLTKPSGNILEIVTYDSYSYNGRISAYTGLSAVSGWPLHNVQWYGGYDGKGILSQTGKLEEIKIADRIADIEKMYTSQDETVVRTLLEKYQVMYAVFGNQEQIWAQEKKKTLNMDIYNSLCRVEWQQQGATLYNCGRRK